MRHLTLILLTALCLVSLGVADVPAGPQSKPARTALDRYSAGKAKLDADYQARLSLLSRQLIGELTAAVKSATKSGDLKEANAIQAVIDQTLIANAPEIRIEVLIDGDSDLHITDAGMYWVQGGPSKPGRHEGRNEPVLINGAQWFPSWSTEAERGPDRSAVYPIRTPTAADYVVAVASIAGVDAKSSVSLKREPGELVLSIPDHELGSHRYAIVLATR